MRWGEADGSIGAADNRSSGVALNCSSGAAMSKSDVNALQEGAAANDSGKAAAPLVCAHGEEGREPGSPQDGLTVNQPVGGGGGSIASIDGQGSGLRARARPL